MKPVTSTYKASRVGYETPLDFFSQRVWVAVRGDVDWTLYGKEKETNSLKPRLLDVIMSYQQAGKEVKKHIVNKEEILIGRNDEEGYYFKFGIYRVETVLSLFYTILPVMKSMKKAPGNKAVGKD